MMNKTFLTSLLSWPSKTKILLKSFVYFPQFVPLSLRHLPGLDLDRTCSLPTAMIPSFQLRTFQNSHLNVKQPGGIISCNFSSYAPCFSWERKITGTAVAKKSSSPNRTNLTVRNITKTNRNSNKTQTSSKSILAGLKYRRFKDKTGQSIKRRVSKLRARILYHNTRFQEKWSAQRSQSSAVVWRLRKKIQAKKENIKTIPNFLTTLRMTSAPILAYLVVSDHFGLALGVFVVAGITDLLDGYIARNFKNQKTALGTALDPLADKLLMCFLTLSLTSADLIPVPLTALILSRDAGLILASFYIRYMTLAPPRTLSRYFDVSHVTAKLHPSNLSKANTALQLLYVACTLASPVFDYVGHPMLQGLMYITATTTFLSGADYALTWRRRLEIVKNK